MFIQIDIALECARLQHRFSLPPLEVQDYSQADLFSSPNFDENRNQASDIVQEILSVGQDLQNNEAGIYAPVDDFSFFLHSGEPPDMGYALDSIGEEQNQTTRIEIGDDNDQALQTGRMVENLRWIGMSNKELEKVNFMYKKFGIFSTAFIFNEKTGYPTPIQLTLIDRPFLTTSRQFQ